jgi:transposase InsO family protein
VHLRNEFIAECFEGKLTMTELCEKYGISRKTGYKWRNRVWEEGVDGLADRTSRPHTNARSWSPESVEFFLDLKEKHPTWGPRKLRAVAQKKFSGSQLPAASTIGEWLRRHGLVRPRKRRRRATPSEQPFASCQGPNETWCADFKGHFPVNKRRVYPLTIMDADSRFLLACDGLTHPTTEATQKVFERTFQRYGLPKAIRTDNGEPFASVALAGLSQLAVWWILLGIVPERIELGKPQQNGRHERMHLTLKQETASPPQPSLTRQQRAFDRFRTEYNEERPHEALGQTPPAAHYEPSPREYTEYLLQPPYPEGYEVRRVLCTGHIRWRGEKVFLSSCLKGQLVALQELDWHRWRVHFVHVPLGVLDESKKPWRVKPEKKK